MKIRTLILTALVAFTGNQAAADNFVTITPTGASAATVANRWVIGSDMSGLSFIDGNSGFPGATATNFFTINGAAIPPVGGNPTGFTSYLPASGAASPQGSVGSALTPNSYSGLTYVAENLSLIGPLSFYAIHHRTTGDYLALIQPGVPTVSDQKPMSAPGGPLTLGGTGYFALSYAADDAGGWGAQLFYYLRTNGLGETIFGSMIPALLSGPTDRWNLGPNRGYTDLAYTSTNVGFGFGPSQFYYLRLDPITQTTFFGHLNPLTGVATDIQDLGGVYRTLVFTATNVGFGANLFYSIGQSAQTINFAAFSSHTACDAPFTFVYPVASSGLAVTLAVSGPATVLGNTVTLTGTVGTVVLTASQAGNGTFSAAPNVAQSFTVTACAPTAQTITFAAIASHTACDAPFTFVAPVASSGLAVTLAVSGPATVLGNTVTLTGAMGTVVLTASQAGNGTFSAAPNVAQSFTVTACAPTAQTITFAAVPDRGLAAGPFTVNPTASSGLPVTLTVTSGPATVSGYTVTLTGAGTVTLQATQAGDATYASAPPVSQTFVAAKSAATITQNIFTKAYYGTPHAGLNNVIASTTPAGLPLIITYNGGSAVPAAVGSYTVVATIDSPIYAGTLTGTLVLTPDPRVTQTVSFGSPPITNHVFGDAPFTLNPSASSGMATNLAVLSGPATVSGNTVTMTGPGTVVLEISQAGHIASYFYAALTQSFVVAKAIAPIALSSLTHTYDGSAKSAVAVTTPAGLIVNLTYNGSATAPSAIGSYAVSATINNANYQGVANATLTIASNLPIPPVVIPIPPVVIPIPPTPPATVIVPASQSVTFNSPVSAFTINTPVQLSGSASSGLPVTFTLVSGNATLNGATLMPSGPGVIVVRATQAGNGSFAPSSTDVNFGSPQKAAQTIALAVGDVAVTSGPITLAATSSAGLPITYSVSGPAQISGNMLTLTGASGTVILSASQAGNASYNPAADVTRAFAVNAIGQQVYLGTIGSDAFALIVSADNTSGMFITRLAATGEAIVADFKINADGSFRTAATSSLPASGEVMPAGSPPVAALPAVRTLSGRVRDGVVTGSIAELGLTFSGTVSPPTGPTAALAGVYRTSVPGSASGDIYVVAGPAGQAFAVALMPSGVSSGTGSISSTGAISIATSDGSIVGNIVPSTGVISGTQIGNGTISAFAGLSRATRPTDRLVNLSSRLRVVSGDPVRTAIAGFVLTGSQSKRVLVRAVGPGLGAFGLSDTLANPRLQLYSGNTLVAENDDWSNNSDVSTAGANNGAFLLSSGSRDSALVANLAPGAYTAIVTGGGGNGVVLVEVYDADANAPISTEQLVNISTRAYVDAGEGTLIAGFVVTGNTPKRMLIRGIGPSLTQFGVAGALLDPQVKLYANGALMASNDNWETGNSTAQLSAAFATTGAFGLSAGSKDAALVITLSPGAYTVQVSGAASSSGVALVELYDLP